MRAVRATPDFGFVLEVAFEGINRSTRHKSGVAMRFMGMVADTAADTASEP